MQIQEPMHPKVCTTQFFLQQCHAHHPHDGASPDEAGVDIHMHTTTVDHTMQRSELYSQTVTPHSCRRGQTFDCAGLPQSDKSAHEVTVQGTELMVGADSEDNNSSASLLACAKPGGDSVDDAACGLRGWRALNTVGRTIP